MRKPASSPPASAKSTACCSKVGLKRGPWTAEEDELLANYINKEGEGRWRTLPKRAGLLRCGKSCRLRWMNYLRPSVKRGHIAPDEEDLILRLHRLLGNRWSLIAGRIPGRTDNEIKNYWNSHLSKKLMSQGIDPRTHKPLTHVSLSSASMLPSATNPNPRPSYNGVLAAAADGTHVSHIRANETTTAQFCSFDPTRNSNNINHHRHHQDATRICSPVNSCKDADEDDDLFSSFLNSLINEDMFACQTQQLLLRYDALLPNPSAVGLGSEAAAPPGFHLHHHQPQ